MAGFTPAAGRRGEAGERARLDARACKKRKNHARIFLVALHRVTARDAWRHMAKRPSPICKCSSKLMLPKRKLKKRRGAKDSPCRPRAPATRACTGSRRLRESRAGWAGRGRCEMVGRAGRAGRGKSAHQSIFAHTQRRGDAEQRLGARASALDGRSPPRSCLFCAGSRHEHAGHAKLMGVAAARRSRTAPSRWGDARCARNTTEQRQGERGDAL